MDYPIILLGKIRVTVLTSYFLANIQTFQYQFFYSCALARAIINYWQQDEVLHQINMPNTEEIQK